MKNFTFVNPTKIVFGKDVLKKLPDLLPSDAKILLTYGGGSIKQNGIYNQVAGLLKDFEWYEFGGIEPNPHYETCLKAVEVIKEKGINFLLAVGGGSVIDGTKFIAAAACSPEGVDPWNLVLGKPKVTAALPFATILTLPATASEMNSGAVITKDKTKEKRNFSSPLLFPRFSILDPVFTFSLPKRQIANGVVDTFVHVMEQYCTYPVHGIMQDYFSEGILKTLLEDGPKALENPQDYDVRASLMWAATFGLNGIIACGVPEDWATHMIGHELTALHGLDHGVTLAIILPGVMKVMQDEKKAKILQMGERLYGIKEGSEQERTDRTIAATEDFFRSMGIKTHLSEYGLGEEVIEPIVRRFEERGWVLGENASITPEKVRQILTVRL